MTMHDLRRPERTTDADSTRPTRTAAAPAHLAPTRLAPLRFDTIRLDGPLERIALAILRRAERRAENRAASRPVAPIVSFHERQAMLLREATARDARERAFERMRLL